MNVSVRQLKDRLSEFLHRAQSGEEIVVTFHNRPMAKLVPVEPADDRETVLAEAAALRESLQGKITGAPMSQTVIEAREDERF